MKLIQTSILALFLFTTTIVHAQEKYEYGQVAYNFVGIGKYSISTSISGEYKVIEEGKLNTNDINSNFIPVNKVLNELAEKGWEVYNTAVFIGGGYWHYYYVKKKKS